MVAQIGAGVTDTAAIIAHENVLARVSAPSGATAALPQRAWPTDTFYGARRELSFEGGHRLNDLLRYHITWKVGANPYDGRPYGSTTCWPLPTQEKSGV